MTTEVITDLELRAALPGDVETIARFVRELALAEDFPGPVTATPADVRQVLFGPNAFASALIVQTAGQPIGFALYYPTYSTITGRRGLHLEDLYIAEPHRGRGLGERVLRRLAAEAHRDGGRLEWWVLRENTPAQRFYRRLGAREVNEIAVWRLAPGQSATT